MIVSIQNVDPKIEKLHELFIYLYRFEYWLSKLLKETIFNSQENTRFHKIVAHGSL